MGWEVASEAPAPKVDSHKDFTTLMDSTFGKGKWHQTGGYRTPDRENELRAEGAETVAPGKLSDHSRGTPENPGAYDIVVDGLNPRQVARKLQETGADFLHYYPEGQRATQGAHLHVAVPIGGSHTPPTSDDWQLVSEEPIEKPKAQAAPKKTWMGEIGESFADIPREIGKQVTEANTKLLADQRKNAGSLNPLTSLETTMDVLGEVGAPITGALTSIIGRPLEAMTGVNRRTIGDIASIAIPFGGEAKGAMEVSKLAKAEGISKNAARVILENRRAVVSEPGVVQRAITAPVRLAAAVTKPGAKALVNFVQKAKGTEAIDQVAMDRVLARMEADAKGGGPNAQDMIDIRTKAQPNLTLMDVGGENVKGYAGRLARKPGESRNILTGFLKNRDAEAGKRMAEAIETHIQRGNAYQSQQALKASRLAIAGPLYDKAYAHPPLNPEALTADGGVLKELAKRPSFRQAMGKALNIAAEEGRDPNSLGIVFDDAGEPRFAKVPSWQTLDYVKRGMDDIIEASRSDVTGKLNLNTYGRAANQTRTQFRTALRKYNPDYGKALDAYAGQASADTAIERGRKFLTRRPEEIRDYLKDATDSEREFYKLGAADALLKRLAQTGRGGDEAKSIMKNDYTQAQLRQLFKSPEEADKFVHSVEAEAMMFDTKAHVVGGSQTGGRVAEDASSEEMMANHAGKAALGAATGRMGSAAKHAMEALKYHAERRDPAIDAAAARILSEPLSSAPGAPGTNALLNHVLERSAQTASPQNRNFLLQASRRLQARDYGRTAAHIGAGAGAVAGASDLGNGQ